MDHLSLLRDEARALASCDATAGRRREEIGPMEKCDCCSKPATVHITEIRNGEVHVLHLCETHAQQYLTGSLPSPDGEADAAAQLEEPDVAVPELAYRSCHMTYAEFRRDGRLGCPHDYQAFEDELLPLIENIHGETQHVGKWPKRAPDASRRRYELIRLRSELQTAVQNEEYEEAARLRDLIGELQSDEGAQGA